MFPNNISFSVVLAKSELNICDTVVLDENAKKNPRRPIFPNQGTSVMFQTNFVYVSVRLLHTQFKVCKQVHQYYRDANI